MKLMIITAYIAMAVLTEVYIIFKFYTKQELNDSDNIVNSVFYSVSWPLYWSLLAVSKIVNKLTKPRKK